MNKEGAVNSSVPKISNLPDKSNEKVKNTVPHYKLFSFADSLDIMLMFIGTIAAFGNGICMPLMTILLGELIDSIGKAASMTVVAHNVSEVSWDYNFKPLFLFAFTKP